MSSTAFKDSLNAAFCRGKAQYIKQIISDNRNYILENDQTVAQYLLAAGTGIEEMREYLSDKDWETIRQANDSHAAEREMAKEVADCVRSSKKTPPQSSMHSRQVTKCFLKRHEKDLQSRI